MVTGSHIPADRNGLKFYTRAGEITKMDEVAILAHLGQGTEGPLGPLEQDAAAEARYITRYVQAFGPEALIGQRIGLYAHSAVGRDVLAAILTGLGADVIELGRSDTFIPVDTEAVNPEVRAQIKAWVTEHRLDALVSTDGDSDRPLLAAEQVVGYEANGGFLLGFEAQGPVGGLAPLITRDCTLPLLTVLYASRAQGIAARVAQEPPVVTIADRLPGVAQSQSHPVLAAWRADSAARAAFLAPLGKQEAALDLTDGLRMVLTDGDVIHLRASGNAPELRLYIETKDLVSAEALLAEALNRLKAAL